MSLTVTVPLVATVVPLTDPVLRATVNVSAPSVNKSAIGPTVKEPALLVTVNVPFTRLKSALVVVVLVIDQYRGVPLATPVVLTLNVPVLPSLMLVD